ncbi:hypothetical protein PINS_up016313 [Pythium insidiosum]|nr:hypothetical protein PINS_up016313 [Pythium insidiosum]
MENNVLQPLQAGFERVITEQLVTGMEDKINTSLSTLPDRMEDGVADIVKGVVEDVATACARVVPRVFPRHHHPSFQAATQKMFEQIHDHVLKGSAIAASSASSAETNRQIQQLVEAVDKLSRKVDQLNVAPNGHGGADAVRVPKSNSSLNRRRMCWR